jgi:hypothetical protein
LSAAARSIYGALCLSRPPDPLVHLVEHVPNARTQAVEDDSATFQRVEHLAQPHVLGLGQLLGKTLDAHRHRLDLAGQRGVLGA